MDAEDDVRDASGALMCHRFLEGMCSGSSIAMGCGRSHAEPLFDLSRLSASSDAYLSFADLLTCATSVFSAHFVWQHEDFLVAIFDAVAESLTVDVYKVSK